MIPEIGHFAVVAALVMAMSLAGAGLAGAATGRSTWVDACRGFAAAQAGLILLGFVLLTVSFLRDDFSVELAAAHSNTLLPWQYKFSAVWGNHEGSFLLWTLVMAGWTLAVALAGGRLEQAFFGRVMGVLGLLNVGFLLFLLLASNPFARLAPFVPQEGNDLNPLLQDFGQIVHPPMLYIGYVGFSVAFAFAVAALLSGRLDAAWARWSRPWTNVAWAFQTVGIALGSWWAYYELGWGGWWFWDPVENASFMPWLAGTALVHSLAVTEKRGAFKSWTVLLALATFSFCLVGAFIVRSGVLTSVHAFAVDPERGLFLLILLAVAIGGALTLYAMRAPAIRSRLQYGGLSRELLLLVNNLLLVVAVAVIFIYTLYPLAYEAATGGDRISIGPPYFNRVFVPLMFVLAGFLALAPGARWKRTPLTVLRRIAVLFGIGAALGGLASLLLVGVLKPAATLAVALATWIVATHVDDFGKRRGARPLGYLGMVTAHVGFAVCMVGVAVTSEYSQGIDARMAVGESVEVGGVSYTLTALDRVRGPNYMADRAVFKTDDGVRLAPEKRTYFARGDVMTEAAIRPGFFGDRYVTLGEPVADDAWGVRIEHKPMVRWIWLGALLMAFGGLVAMADGRYRRLASRDARVAPVGSADAQPA